MLIGLLMGLAIAAGLPWQVMAVVGLAIVSPPAFLIGAGLWGLVHRVRTQRPVADDEAIFLRGLAAELASGASLRSGVVAAAGRVDTLDLGAVTRLCRVGRSADEIGDALIEALSAHRRSVAAAFRLSGRTGGAVAPVFESLAKVAEADGRLVRERRALTAQARMSAWIVGGAPVALVALALLTGWGPDPAELGPIGGSMVGLGICLIAMGSATVWVMVRAADR